MERLPLSGPDVLIDTTGNIPGTGRWCDADVLVTFGAPVQRRNLASHPKLRAVVSPLAGIEWIDRAAMSEAEILVISGQTRENSESMAEATFMLMLAALYRLHATERMLRSGAIPPADRRMLRGKTVGIVGFGQIARSLVDRLKPWDVVVQAHSRSAQDYPGVSFTDLDVLLQSSDVVILLASLNADSHHLLDRSRLALLRRGAILVNTARGALIDEAALADHLRQDSTAMAMLDVFEVEPLPIASPLRELPNAILTPHAIGHTRELIEAVPRHVVASVLAILDGRVPDNCRNPEIAPAWLARHAVMGARRAPA